MPNGKVLVAGGLGPENGVLRRCELYDPASGTWKLTGGLDRKRLQHTATLLHNGMVLVAGAAGFGRRAELYDPASESWIVTGSLTTLRSEHTATLLPGGQVLVAGGYVSPVALASTELYDLGSGTWTATGSLATARELHTATLLPDGRVLIAGGADGSFNSLANAELGVRVGQ
jgi:hypothetical protein